MRIKTRRAVAGLAVAVVAASACLLGATTASAAPAAAKLMEIGTVPVPASVQANLRAALATAEKQAPNVMSMQVCYSVHISNVGWTSAWCNSTILGDYHDQIEAIEMVVSPDVGSVEYQAHVENIGWQGMKYNGQMAGTQGQDLRMEAITMDLYNNPNKDFIVYNVYLPDYGGWQYRSENGQQAGTTGVSEPITALWIDIT